MALCGELNNTATCGEPFERLNTKLTWQVGFTMMAVTARLRAFKRVNLTSGKQTTVFFFGHPTITILDEESLHGFFYKGYVTGYVGALGASVMNYEIVINNYEIISWRNSCNFFVISDVKY